MEERPREERPRDDRPRDGRDRFRDDRGPRGEGGGRYSVKARLRAKARKKARKSGRRMFKRSKPCRFCADASIPIDYKDTKVLRPFLSETGKMIPRRVSGSCARHQRKIKVAIKRARHLALLPFIETNA